MMEAGIRAGRDRAIQTRRSRGFRTAASEAAGYPVEVQGSGRTDGGVHAKGQTASVIFARKSTGV